MSHLKVLRETRSIARRPRRGATLVFVAMLSVALVGMTALAVDFSRLYVGTNELQTVADAAALRGALQMQRVPATNPSDTIIAFAARNPALSGTVVMTGADIEPIFWRPDSTPLTGVTWAVANAVRVTARRPANFTFGKILTSITPTPVRRSTAWIANIASSSCIKPWGMPMPSVLEMVGASPTPVRSLTQAEIEILRGLTTLQRTIIIAPPYSGNGQIPFATPNGNWAALRVNGNGMRQYQDAVEDATCSNTVVGIGSQWVDKPGNNLDTKTSDSIDESVCRFNNGSDTCYDIPTGTIPGVSVVVAYTTIPVSNGAENVTVLLVGEFVVQCYRQKAANNTCVSTKVSASEWKKYDEGTLLGYVIPNFAGLGGATLGNTISTGQRLILVR